MQCTHRARQPSKDVLLLQSTACLTGHQTLPRGGGCVLGGARRRQGRWQQRQRREQWRGRGGGRGKGHGNETFGIVTVGSVELRYGCGSTPIDQFVLVVFFLSCAPLPTHTHTRTRCGPNTGGPAAAGAAGIAAAVSVPGGDDRGVRRRAGRAEADGRDLQRCALVIDGFWSFDCG